MKRYQASNGLPPTGIVDKMHGGAMNVPAASRLKQLQANLTRLGEYAKMPKKYVVVNIPAAQIEAVENDQVVSRHAGVVGKIDRPTPILKSSIQELNFNRRLASAADRDREGSDPQGPGDGAERPERAREVRASTPTAATARSSTPSRSTGDGNAKSLTYKQQPGP